MVKWIPQRFINIINLMPEEVGTRAAQPLDAVCEGWRLFLATGSTGLIISDHSLVHTYITLTQTNLLCAGIWTLDIPQHLLYARICPNSELSFATAEAGSDSARCCSMVERSRTAAAQWQKRPREPCAVWISVVLIWWEHGLVHSSSNSVVLLCHVR